MKIENQMNDLGIFIDYLVDHSSKDFVTERLPETASEGEHIVLTKEFCDSIKEINKRIKNNIINV